MNSDQTRQSDLSPYCLLYKLPKYILKGTATLILITMFYMKDLDKP